MSMYMPEPGFDLRPRPKKSVLPPPNKKRRIEHKIEEISFDDSNREDYLTGFHKRKVQRIKRAQEENEKKAREERREMRKQLREERKEELQEHVDAVNRALRDAEDMDLKGGSSADAWNGFDDEKEILPPIDHQEEYVDEDRYTTVTVETVDVSKDGLQKHVDEDSSEEAAAAKKKKYDPPAEEKGKEKKVWPKKDKTKKFRYESKAERRMTRGKQKAGNKAKAEARRDR